MALLMELLKLNNGSDGFLRRDPRPCLSKQTSVAADFAIWRRASPPAFPGADVTLEFTSVSMPTGSTVTVSTVTLAMAWKHIRKPQLMSSLLSVQKKTKKQHFRMTHQLTALRRLFVVAVILVLTG